MGMESGNSAAGKYRVRAQADPAQEPQSQPAACPADEKTKIALARLMKALTWVLGLTALAFGSNYLYLAEKGSDGSRLAIWIFLGFCSLVVAGQLIPIFRVKVAPREGEELTQQENTTPEE